MTNPGDIQPDIQPDETHERRLRLIGGSQVMGDKRGLLYDVVDLQAGAARRISTAELFAEGVQLIAYEDTYQTDPTKGKMV